MEKLKFTTELIIKTKGICEKVVFSVLKNGNFKWKWKILRRANTDNLFSPTTNKFEFITNEFPHDPDNMSKPYLLMYLSQQGNKCKKENKKRKNEEHIIFLLIIEL